MKKIMFSTEYGLQQGVIDRTKTMTRRADKKLNYPLVTGISEWGIDDKGNCYLAITYSTGLTEVVYPAYQIGEELAVAQRYADDDVLIFNAYNGEGQPRKDGHKRHQEMLASEGYRNKMFVKAEYMPHRIRITDIKVERLQDISVEDILCEGVYYYNCGIDNGYTAKGLGCNFPTARDAFSALIDKVNGTGTWQKNPWVFAYTFELVR